MNVLNVEIKARCTDLDSVRDILHNRQAEFKGLDRQQDTYFKVPQGRLKLREGNIEHNLIYYRRADTRDPKASDIHLVPMNEAPGIKELLHDALGIEIVVNKQREIYYIDNVKFHLDRVEQLGSFIEIEAIGREGQRDESALREQCTYYMDLFGIDTQDLVAGSYSDLLAEI